MANIDLTKYGITGTTEIIRNPSYEFLFVSDGGGTGRRRKRVLPGNRKSDPKIKRNTPGMVLCKPISGMGFNRKERSYGSGISSPGDLFVSDACCRGRRNCHESGSRGGLQRQPSGYFQARGGDECPGCHRKDGRHPMRVSAYFLPRSAVKSIEKMSRNGLSG